MKAWRCRGPRPRALGAAALLALALPLLVSGSAARADSALLREAIEAYVDGDWRFAVELVDAAFRAGEVSQEMTATALTYRAIAQARLGNAEAAWADAGTAIETSRVQAIAWLGAATVAEVLGEPERGLPYANTAVRYSPNSADIRTVRAALLRALGDDELAARDTEIAEALRADDSLMAIDEELARERCVIGNDPSCLERLSGLMPDGFGPGTAALIGYLLVDRGEEALGRETMDWAVTSDDAAAETWLYAGLLAYRDGQDEIARDDFREALRRDPLDPRPGLGLLAASPADRWAALEEWRSVADGHPQDASHDSIVALADTTDWQVAADQAEAILRSPDGPFVAMAVALLGERELPEEQIASLLGRIATAQRFGYDDFTRRLADIERRRLAGM